jgi:phosphohistidine phosphatase
MTARTDLKLYLMRHAKSDWDADFDRDHDRPLASRGERDADAVGRFLAAADRVPDRVLSSSATRARTTVERASTAGGWTCTVNVLEPLYGADPAEVIAHVARHARGARRLMVAGHEPTTSELLSLLVGGGSFRVPTAAVAALQIAVSDWDELERGVATLEWLLIPKLLKAFR